MLRSVCTPTTRYKLTLTLIPQHACVSLSHAPHLLIHNQHELDNIIKLSVLLLQQKSGKANPSFIILETLAVSVSAGLVTFTS
jgi:hypothetical protein